MKQAGYWFDPALEVLHIVYPNGMTQAYIYDTWVTYPKGAAFKKLTPNDFFIGEL